MSLEARSSTAAASDGRGGGGDGSTGLVSPSLATALANSLGQAVHPSGRDLLSRLFFYERDLLNMAQYGVDAPLSASLVFVDPRVIKKAINHQKSQRIESALIKGGDWDLETRDIDTIKKVRGVKQRIVDGASWEETAAWRQNLAYLERGGGLDGIKSMDDIVARYKKLDKFIAVARKDREAAFKTRAELSPGSFREALGIMVNIGRDGELLFGMRGCHRLAIAQALALECIPAQLGIVHEAAVRDGVWRKNLISDGDASALRFRKGGTAGAEKPEPAPVKVTTSKAPPTAEPAHDTSKPYYPIRYGAHTSSSSIEYGVNRESHWNGVPVDKFKRLIPVLPGHSVVEIGAAEGILSLTIAPHKAMVRAIDIAPIRHERGLKLKQRWLELGKPVANCEMMLADIFEKPEVLSGFDTLVASRVIYYFGDRLEEFMRNARQHVRYVCFIGNEKRARLYKKGAFKELGEYAKYTTSAGLQELVERHGFKVIRTIETDDPVVIAERGEQPATA